MYYVYFAVLLFYLDCFVLGFDLFGYNVVKVVY